MYIFNQTFTGKGKASGKDFYQVRLFEKRTTQDNRDYFKDLTLFVDKDVFDTINKKAFKFGDVVDVVKSEPLYFGGPEQLKDLELVEESPYFKDWYAYNG